MDYFIIFVTTVAGLYFHWWLYVRIKRWMDRDLALSLAITGIEVDLRCINSEWLIFHDRFLQRTTNGHGPVHGHSLAELRSLQCHNGEAIPLLGELLQRVAGRCQLNLELKEEGDLEQLAVLLRQACRDWHFQPEQLLLSSFNHYLLADIAARGWPYPRAALFASLPLTLAADAAALACSALHIDIEVVNRQLVNDAHRRGLKVRVYTVDDASELQQLAAMGVDGVFCNDPARALALLGTPS